jgi:hypothetical protein
MIVLVALLSGCIITTIDPIDRAIELAESGRLEEALPFFQSAIETDVSCKTDSSCHRNLGMALLELRREDDALKVLKQALVIDPYDMSTRDWVASLISRPDRISTIDLNLTQIPRFACDDPEAERLILESRPVILTACNFATPAVQKWDREYFFAKANQLFPFDTYFSSSGRTLYTRHDSHDPDIRHAGGFEFDEQVEFQSSLLSQTRSQLTGRGKGGLQEEEEEDSDDKDGIAYIQQEVLRGSPGAVRVGGTDENADLHLTPIGEGLLQDVQHFDWGFIRRMMRKWGFFVESTVPPSNLYEGINLDPMSMHLWAGPAGEWIVHSGFATSHPMHHTDAHTPTPPHTTIRTLIHTPIRTHNIPTITTTVAPPHLPPLLCSLHRCLHPSPL